MKCISQLYPDLPVSLMNRHLILKDKYGQKGDSLVLSASKRHLNTYGITDNQVSLLGLSVDIGLGELLERFQQYYYFRRFGGLSM